MNVGALESSLKTKLKTHSVFSPEVDTLLLHIRTIYEPQLFDSDETVYRTAESSLWRTCFYKPIEILRQTAKTTKDRSSFCTSFNLFITNACKYYEQTLIPRVKAELGCSSFESFVCPSHYEPLPARIKRSLFLAHRFCVIIGDLVRYSLSVCPQSDSSYDVQKMFHWYNLACSVNVFNGGAHNQLAVVALLKRDLLSAVYHFIRAISSVDPFTTANNNLSSMTRKIVTHFETRSPSECLAAVESTEHCYCLLIDCLLLLLSGNGVQEGLTSDLFEALLLQHGVTSSFTTEDSIKVFVLLLHALHSKTSSELLSSIVTTVFATFLTSDNDALDSVNFLICCYCASHQSTPLENHFSGLVDCCKSYASNNLVSFPSSDISKRPHHEAEAQLRGFVYYAPTKPEVDYSIVNNVDAQMSVFLQLVRSSLPIGTADDVDDSAADSDSSDDDLFLLNPPSLMMSSLSLKKSNIEVDDDLFDVFK
ncbi:hypothetical protein GEMRC1_010597 [Eukaryota sp. GEM-RC1]